MKMPTIVGIFIFSSRENNMISWVEQKTSFITSEPDLEDIFIPTRSVNDIRNCFIIISCHLLLHC